jgi:hypothetical protein
MKTLLKHNGMYQIKTVDSYWYAFKMVVTNHIEHNIPEDLKLLQYSFKKLNSQKTIQI